MDSAISLYNIYFCSQSDVTGWAGDTGHSQYAFQTTASKVTVKGHGYQSVCPKGSKVQRLGQHITSTIP